MPTSKQTRTKLSENGKRVWASLTYRAKMSAMRVKAFEVAWADPKTRVEISNRRSKVTKAVWKNPATRDKMLQGIMKRRERTSKLMKKLWVEGRMKKCRVTEEVQVKVTEMRENGIKWREIASALNIPLGTASSLMYRTHRQDLSAIP